MGGGDGSGRLAYEVTAIALEIFPGVSCATLDSLDSVGTREGGAIQKARSRFPGIGS